MAKKRASLYFNNEVAGNGGTRYVKGTQPGKHSPVSQENVHLTKSYKQFMSQLMGGTATVIDPNSAQASQPWLYNTTPRFTQVNVIRDDKGNITTDFNIQQENTITNGVYSVVFRNENNQIPSTVGISAQWKQEGDKWKYWDGEKFVTADWVQIGEKWYYIGADQYMVTGLHIIDGKQYYFKKKEEDLENKNNYGQMIAHKWWKINDIWYYFHSDGSMLFSGWRMDAAQEKWYYCGSDGKMVKSKIINWGDDIYYVDEDGAMAVNEEVVDPDTGIKYQADEDGKCTEVGDRVEMNIPTYYQNDYPTDYFGDKNNGGKPISKVGCGPTSMAMVISYLTGTVVTPPEVATWGKNYYVPGQGAKHNLVPDAAAHWNLKCKQIVATPANIYGELEAGHPIVALMGAGKTFTGGGHFIVLRGYTADKKILVNDPNHGSHKYNGKVVSHKDYNSKEFPIDTIINENKVMWSIWK